MAEHGMLKFEHNLGVNKAITRAKFEGNIDQKLAKREQIRKLVYLGKYLIY